MWLIAQNKTALSKLIYVIFLKACNQVLEIYHHIPYLWEQKSPNRQRKQIHKMNLPTNIKKNYIRSQYNNQPKISRI